MYLNRLKEIFSIIFIFLVFLFSIIVFVTGSYYKFTKLKKDNKFFLFFRKNMGIGLITILFTLFTVLSSTTLNKIFIDCPAYEENPNHPWFKKHFAIQIMDVLISLMIIVIVKFLLTSIITNSVEYFVKEKKNSAFKFLFVEDYKTEKIKMIDVRQKGGNVTTAFITLLFQTKLKNKLEYFYKITSN